MSKTLYFDTNIYSFIESCGESKKLRQYLDNKGYKVTASDTNIFEIYAIPNNTKRISELRTLTDVASIYERKPATWKHAQELKKEIARCRPEWVKKIVFDKNVINFLDGHLMHWKNAKALKPPPASAFATYRKDFEAGIKNQTEFQKTYRKTKIEKELDRLNLGKFDSSGNLISDFKLDFDDPEVFWRVDNLMVWYSALVIKSAASRDYADWVLPYIKTTQFTGESYVDFWLSEVKSENMPYNRLIGLITYYQTEYKVTHGNSADQIHSTHLLDCDVFFTADKTYHKVLEAVIGKHFPSYPKPILLNRGAPSAFDEVVQAL